MDYLQYDTQTVNSAVKTEVVLNLIINGLPSILKNVNLLHHT